MVAGGSFFKNGNKTKLFISMAIFHRNPIGSRIPTTTGHHHQQQQSRVFHARFPQSIFRKTKDVDLSAPALLPSRFCSRTTETSSTGFKFIDWYLGMLKSRPILTKSITSALIYTAADLSSQTITKSSSEHYDPVRTVRMAGYGMIILGPSLHFWFNFVSKALPKRDLITTFKKMFLGQAVYGPIMTVTFFSVNAVLQGETGGEIIARLKRDLLPTLLNGAMYWPVCDFITFKFIPVHLQPLVSNSFAYLWTVYITYMASLEKAGSQS